jgi:hypothetical protein
MSSQTSPVSSLRIIPVAAGFLAAVLFAEWLAAFLEVDSCLDAGGVIRESGFCDVDTGAYVPVLARPGLQVLWGTFLAVTFAVGCSVKWGVGSLLRRV